MRTGFADIGTNMAKLLVASWEDEEMHVLHEEERYIRLGERMNVSGTISPAALERLRYALVDFRSATGLHGADQLFAVGTSALRDATNSNEAVDLARQKAGVPLEIVSGSREARWMYMGACSAFDELQAPVAVCDIGGGSTEVAVGKNQHEAPERIASLPIGSVRITEEHEASPPISAATVESIREDIRDEIGDPDNAPPIKTLILATATATVLAEINGTLESLTDEAVSAWAARLSGMTTAEILALAPEKLKGRADIYPAGILILQAIMAHLRADICLISPRRMIHGYAINHFRGML